MFADAALAERIGELDRQYFAGLVTAARETVCPLGEPFLDAGGTIAFFAGDGSPLTKANGAFADDEIEAVQAFYQGRATRWEAVVTPFAGAGPLKRLVAAGAEVEGCENTLYRPLSDPLTADQSPSSLEIVADPPIDLWSDVSMRAFFGEEPDGVAQELQRLLERAVGMKRYVALWEGKPAGAASLNMGCGLAFLGGMATLPSYRSKGIQTALIRRRIEDAREHADVAVVGATPGSASHRNAERCGFRIAYTQLSLRVPTAAAAS